MRQGNAELTERFLRHMPASALDEQQRRALACLIDGMDANEAALHLRISPWRAKRLYRETVEALGFENSAQLLMRVGALCAAPDHALLFDGLTRREREICALLLTTGDAQKHIAAQLGLSEDTVKFHVKNIYRKLEVQSRMELIAKAGEREA